MPTINETGLRRVLATNETRLLKVSTINETEFESAMGLTNLSLIQLRNFLL